MMRIKKDQNTRSSVRKEVVWLMFLTVLVMFSRPTVAEPQASELNNKVDAVFAALDKKVLPGCAFAVVRQGKIIYERGYGMANLDYNLIGALLTALPITPKSYLFSNKMNVHGVSECHK